METRRIVVAAVERAEAFGSRTAFRFDAARFRRRDSVDHNFDRPIARPGFSFRQQPACDDATNRSRPTSGFHGRGFRIDAGHYECKSAQRRRTGFCRGRPGHSRVL